MKRIILFLILFFVLTFAVQAEQVYTVANFKADIQTYTSGDFNWTDSVWLRVINTAIQNVGNLEIKSSIDTITVKPTTATPWFALPIKFKKIWSAMDNVTWETYENLAVRNWGQAGTGVDAEVQKVDAWVSSKGKLGKAIGFYPKFTASDSVFVLFCKVPDKVTAVADTIDIIEPYHTALLHAGLKWAWKRAKNNNQSSLEDIELKNELNNANITLNSLLPDIWVATKVLKKGGQ